MNANLGKLLRERLNEIGFDLNGVDIPDQEVHLKDGEKVTVRFQYWSNPEHYFQLANKLGQMDFEDFSLSQKELTYEGALHNKIAIFRVRIKDKPAKIETKTEIIKSGWRKLKIKINFVASIASIIGVVFAIYIFIDQGKGSDAIKQDTEKILKNQRLNQHYPTKSRIKIGETLNKINSEIKTYSISKHAQIEAGVFLNQVDQPNFNSYPTLF